MAMGLLSWLHFSSAILALLIGPRIFSLPKGDAQHRKLGRIYAVAMLTCCLSAFGFWPHTGFTFFQGLNFISLGYLIIAVAMAVTKPVQNWLLFHYFFMTYGYLGLLAAALARIPSNLGMAPNIAAIVSMLVTFGIGAVLVEKHGQALKHQLKRAKTEGQRHEPTTDDNCHATSVTNDP